MNRQALVSALVLSVVSLACGFVVHALLLAPDYAALPALYLAADAGAARMPWMLISHVLAGIGLTWLYRAGRGDAPWPAQGLRFGAAVALAATLPNFIVYYAVQPNPPLLVLKQVLFGGAAMLATGLAAAWLNRERAL